MTNIQTKSIKLCMISTVPPEGGGVSTYTENLVHSLDSSIDMTIIAQKNGPSREESKIGANISIVNCWKTGLVYPFQIFKELCARKPQIVHVQHEYFIFGRAISAGIFPLVTIFAKILRVKVFVTMHGVVNPVEIKDPELSSIGNESLNGIPRTFLQAGLLLITRLIHVTSDKIIVMNNAHRNVLIHEYHCPENKIVIIPHGIPESIPIAQDTAKKILGFSGLKIALYFGYITKYKGIDVLVKAFKSLNSPNSTLIIGGAAHPRLKNEPEYKRFWDTMMAEISGDKRIKFVGFIPDKILSTYISAADVVVFPYVASFSTGGPMNITLGHHRPVIASRVSSFSDTLPDCAIFKTGSVRDLSLILARFLDDEALKSYLSSSTKDLADERSWKQVGKSTSDLYFHSLKKQKS